MKLINRLAHLSTLIWLPLCSPTFASSALSMFIDDILANNPSIRAATSNVFAARARGRALAQPLYNPELTAEKQNALENTESIGINQTFDWSNKRGARLQVGAANARMADAQLSDLRQQLAAQILTALARYHAERKAATLARERSSLLIKFASLTQKRYKSGDIARIDYDLAQLALSEALAQQAEIEVNANQALQVLRATTAFTRENWPKLNTTLPDLDPSTIDINHLAYNLPAVLALHHEYQSARAQIKLATKNRIPDPTIGFQGGKSSGDGESKKLYGLTLNIPLFIRNSYRFELDAANYDAFEAEQKQENIILLARAEIISSAERYQILHRTIQKWQQLSGKPLGDGIELITRLWQAGEITTTDYIVQVKQRIDSQIAGVKLKGQAWEAWIEWLKASGQVESWLQRE